MKMNTKNASRLILISILALAGAASAASARRPVAATPPPPAGNTVKPVVSTL